MECTHVCGAVRESTGWFRWRSEALEAGLAKHAAPARHASPQPAPQTTCTHHQRQHTRAPADMPHSPVGRALEEQAHPRQRSRLHQRADVKLGVGGGVARGQVQEQRLADRAVLGAPAGKRWVEGWEGRGAAGRCRSVGQLVSADLGWLRGSARNRSPPSPVCPCRLLLQAPPPHTTTTCCVFSPLQPSSLPYRLDAAMPSNTPMMVASCSCAR